MKLVKAIVRPNKMDEVRDALVNLGCSGMTVTEVRGHGNQKGQTAMYRGKIYNVPLPPKLEVEVVVSDDKVNVVVKTIMTTAHTGQIGDGRIFVLPVEQAYSIRTREPLE